jgi:N utilization substance protein A
MERTIGFRERRLIEELRIFTRATAVDCIIDERFDRVIYIIKPGDMGLAIGRKGESINRLSRQLGRRLEMVEYAETPEALVANTIRPAELAALRPSADGASIDLVIRRGADLGIVIGRGGGTIEKVRILCRRLFDLTINDVLVAAPGGEEGVPA